MVNLNNATLTLNWFEPPAPYSRFTLIDLEHEGAMLTGTFTATGVGSLDQDATFTVDGVTFRIDYAGGDGNDVVLIVDGPPDFGDAPDTGAGTGPGNYQTTLTDGGPRHQIVPGLRLGATVDGETEATPNVSANGDDVDPGTPASEFPASTDDEDGVLSPFTDLIGTEGASPTITLLVTNTTGSAATLAGWIDYNQNGEFEASERAVATVASGAFDARVTLEFPRIPKGLAGTTYARFRLSTDAGFAADPSSVGALGDGEVEDYLFQIAATSSGTVTSSVPISPGPDPKFGTDGRELFGFSISNAGDLNGNGVPAIAIGAPGDDTGGSLNSNRGSVYLLPTSGTAVRIAHQTNGGPTLDENDSFGSSVASVGDLDGDGVPDLAVGAPGDDTGGGENAKRGAVHVLLLNANGSVKSSTKIAHGTFIGSGETLDLADRDYFGTSVASLGDLDGDGVMDLAVGANGDSSNRGAVYVLLMTSAGTVKSSHKIANGSSVGSGGTLGLASGDYFGSSLVSLGDLDGDGIAELAVGARKDSSGTMGALNHGAVYVLFLSSDGSIKSASKITRGTNIGSGGTLELASNDFFGVSLANVGDLDGNGVADLAVGATGDADGRGAVHLLMLDSAGNVRSAAKIADGTEARISGPIALNPGDGFGASVTSVNGRNVDGTTDLFIGAPGNDSGGTDRGAFYQVSLSPPPDFGDAPQRVPGADRDGDGILDEIDNAYLVANPDQEDADEDGSGDVVDPAPDDPMISGGNVEYTTLAANNGPSHGSSAGSSLRLGLGLIERLTGSRTRRRMGMTRTASTTTTACSIPWT